MPDNSFDEDYFLRGKETGVSLYEDYRWLPDLTIPMVQAMIDHLGIKRGESILDFGCARGYVVKAFREMDYNAYGVDVSEWAIKNCDPAVQDYVFCNEIIMHRGFDWIIAKDVLEHVPNAYEIIGGLHRCADKGIFVVVPLSPSHGKDYTVPDYEKDATHIHRWTLATWTGFFLLPGWSVTASYRVPGIKDNYAAWEMGNGFITARRLV